MPEVVVQIERVDQTAIEIGWQYTVTCTDAAKTWQFQTLNQWRASLCRQAAKLGVSVRIVWKDGSPKRWGGTFPKVLVSATLEQS